ncbi:Acetophenone carboxylase gamma subunit [bacterium HR15]|nr:Acetophenone carboxylase gamma subunit [bacterium HR15]
MAHSGWRIGVDTGGTFTDFIAWNGQQLYLLKVPSTPAAPEQAVLQGVAQIVQSKPSHLLLLHGTTVGTNALLERKGARVAFLTTEGFRDLLFLARQTRRELYSLCPQPAPCLAERALCAEVPERIAYDGMVLQPLDTSGLPRLIRRWKRDGVEAVAVCLLFSYANPAHERRLGELLSPHFPVSLSSEVAPEFREYERASTTFLNAYLMPILTRYLHALQTKITFSDPEGFQRENLRGATTASLLLSHSNGGLMGVAQACRLPISTVLSGPAAGVMGAWAVGRQSGHPRLLTFDMGGTSTDVALIDKEPTRVGLSEVAGMPIRLPQLEIHTIGAGGGSIASLDAAGSLRVGPQSAAADPGPAAYGKGDLPTVTDAHVVLGHLLPETFGFGQLPLQPEGAWRALEPLARALGISVPETAEAILEQARARMAKALRLVSAARGYDPADFTLLAFGGAGPLHTTALARLLGVRRWLLPRFPGVLSAYGLLWMDVVHEAVRTVLGTPFASGEWQGAYLNGYGSLLHELHQECAQALQEAGAAPEAAHYSLYADLRYRGQSYEITVLFDPAQPQRTAEMFHELHARHYGFSMPGRPLELVNLRMRAVALQPKPVGGEWQAKIFPPTQQQNVFSDPDGTILGANGDSTPLAPHRLPPTTRLYLSGEWVEVPVLWREALSPRQRVPVPALIVQPDTTLLIEPGWQVEVDPQGNLVGQRV